VSPKNTGVLFFPVIFWGMVRTPAGLGFMLKFSAAGAAARHLSGRRLNVNQMQSNRRKSQ
jgi:hypothetical protein